MNKFTKELIMLLILASIGIGAALISINLEENHKIKNVALDNQMIGENLKEKNLLTNKTGIFTYINETTAEVMFDNESLGVININKIFYIEDLKLPIEKEKQAIDIILSDPEVKKTLDGKKYNITKVQKVAITTGNQTYLSEDNVVVEIEVGDSKYLVNVDMVKRKVQGYMVAILR